MRNRTPGDAARFAIARERDALLKAGIAYPSRDLVQSEICPDYNAVLANASNEDILSISDADAIFIANWAPDVDGQMPGELLVGAMPSWAGDDIFYSATSDAGKPNSAQSLDTANAQTPKKKGGRRPAHYWEELAIQAAVHLHDNGPPEPRSDMSKALLQGLADAGHHVAESTIRDFVAKLCDRLDSAPN